MKHLLQGLLYYIPTKKQCIIIRAISQILPYIYTMSLTVYIYLHVLIPQKIENLLIPVSTPLPLSVNKKGS